jgi:hypothetical protein
MISNVQEHQPKFYTDCNEFYQIHMANIAATTIELKRLEEKNLPWLHFAEHLVIISHAATPVLKILGGNCQSLEGSGNGAGGARAGRRLGIFPVTGWSCSMPPSTDWRHMWEG